LVYEQIVAEQKGRVRIVYMNRPERRNALSEKMIAEQISALKEADVDRDVGAVILSGKGEAFCAGADLGDFSRMGAKTAPVIHQEGMDSTELFKMGFKMTKPLIAAVNGPAMGGGCGLAAMCHLAVAGDKARFGTPEIKVGIFPLVIFPLIIRAVGQKKALEMAICGQTLSAAEAAEIGLVNRVFPMEELYEGALKMASDISDRSPLVLKLGLNAFNTISDMEVNKAMDYLNTLRVIDFMSEDFKEGANAFIEKRKPVWTGR